MTATNTQTLSKNSDAIARNRYDRFMYFVAIVNPLMTLPQAITIWTSQSAQDVSLTTWVAYAISAICWMIYSIIHRETALLINSVIWFVLELVVIAGILIHN